MSVRFDAAADGLRWSTALLDRDADYSFCCWVYLVTAPASGQYSTIFAIHDDAGEYDIYDIFNNGVNNRFLVATSSTYNETIGSTNLSTATWYFVCGVRSGAAARNLYFATMGATSLTNEVSHTISPGAMTPSTNEIGAILTTNLDPLDGRVFAFKCWSAALTTTELMQEMYTRRPHRFANLNRWLPTFNGASVRAEDWARTGNVIEDGTLTDEDDPPISYGAPNILPQIAVIAATGQPASKRMASVAFAPKKVHNLGSRIGVW